jgi:hypothetical protein
VYGLLVVEVAFNYIYFFFMLSYFIFLPLYIFIFLTKYFFKLTRVDFYFLNVSYMKLTYILGSGLVKLTRVDSLFSQCFLYEIDFFFSILLYGIKLLILKLCDFFAFLYAESTLSTG